MTENVKKEPIFRICKNDQLPLKKKIVIKTITIGIALILSTIFIVIVSGKNPIPAYMYMFSGSFGNQYKFFDFLKETVLLLGIAVALVPAYKMRFWNVGAQGQILMGALAGITLMIYFESLPNFLLLILMIVAAIIGGAIWGFIPGFFKAKFHTNETLFTLMMNYIAIQLVSFATESWRGSKSALGNINIGSHKGWFPTMDIRVGGDVVIPMLIIGLLVIAMYFYINKTKHGYEIKVIGESRSTAKYVGIKYKWVIIRTMIISGALCGLVGFFYVSSFDHTISATTSGSYGFTAIIVAWLGAFNPFLMIIYASLIVFLNKGAINLKNVSYSPNLNEYSCEFIVLLLILAIMLSEFFINYRIVLNLPKKNKLNKVKEGK